MNSFQNYCKKRGVDIEHEIQILYFFKPCLRNCSSAYQARAVKNHLIDCLKMERAEIPFSSFSVHDGGNNEEEAAAGVTVVAAYEEIGSEKEIAEIVWNKAMRFVCSRYGEATWNAYIGYVQDGNYQKTARENNLPVGYFRGVIRATRDYINPHREIKKKSNKNSTVVELYRKGLSRSEISRRLGVKPETVRKYLERAGITGTGNKRKIFIKSDFRAERKGVLC